MSESMTDREALELMKKLVENRKGTVIGASRPKAESKPQSGTNKGGKAKG